MTHQSEQKLLHSNAIDMIRLDGMRDQGCGISELWDCWPAPQFFIAHMHVCYVRQAVAVQVRQAACRHHQPGSLFDNLTDFNLCCRRHGIWHDDLSGAKVSSKSSWTHSCCMFDPHFSSSTFRKRHLLVVRRFWDAVQCTDVRYAWFWSDLHLKMSVKYQRS